MIELPIEAELMVIEWRAVYNVLTRQYTSNRSTLDAR
jgi:hypothetical protein